MPDYWPEFSPNYLDALNKLTRILNAISEDGLYNRYTVPVCLESENAVMSRMRQFTVLMSSRLEAEIEKNNHSLIKWREK